MNRLVLMVIKNFWKAPGAYGKLCYYAKHTDKYDEEVKYRHIQYILNTAVKSGKIDLQVFGKENIPKKDGFLIYANHQGLFDIVALIDSYKPLDQKGSKKVIVQLHYLKPIYYEEYKDLNTVELAKMVYSRIEKIINEKAGINRSKEGL